MKLFTFKHLYFYLSVLLIYFLIYFIRPDYVHEYFIYIVFFNWILDLVFKYININVFLNQKHSVFAVLGSTFLRLALSIVFVFVFGLIETKNFMLFTINFVLVFLLFIIFEITILLFNLHRESENNESI